METQPKISDPLCSSALKKGFIIIILLSPQTLLEISTEGLILFTHKYYKFFAILATLGPEEQEFMSYEIMT